MLDRLHSKARRTDAARRAVVALLAASSLSLAVAPVSAARAMRGGHCGAHNRCVARYVYCMERYLFIGGRRVVLSNCRRGNTNERIYRLSSFPVSRPV